MVSEHIFQFWRVVVAAAHADHKITQEERDFIIKKFDFIDFSDEQKSQLRHELDHAQDPATLFSAIEPAQKRAECLYMLHNLFHSDNELHPLEETLYKVLKQKQVESLDAKAIEEDFHEFLKDQEAQREAFENYITDYKADFSFFSGLKKWFQS